MEKIFALLVTLGVLGTSLADLPPPVKPEPRQFLPTVHPEPRQSGSCNVQYAFQSAGQQALLQSPNFPSSYPAYSNCQYSLTSPPGTIIELSCTEFNVEYSTSCAYDVFYFSPSGSKDFKDALRTCGKGTFTRNSTTNAMTIGFNSDAGNPYSSVPYRFQCTLSVYSVSAPTTVAPATTARPAPAPTNSSTNCQCGVRNEAMRIVGGSEASVNEFPWRCNLYHPNMGVFCGATVISNSWVITAAHCTAAVPAGTTYYVDCADHDITSNSESQNVVIPIEKVVQHAQYDKETQNNDISLLKLQTPLTFSRTIQPICLPYKMVGQDVNGKTVTASGWGTTSSGGQQSVVLKKVDLPVLGTSECQKYYGSSVTSNMICTYKPGSDTCQGDSGGSIDYKDPETGKYLDLGVVSWGVGCAGTNQPGVYTKLTNYLGWIETQTGENYCKV